MDSSTALVAAASGLEKFMAGTKTTAFKDSTVAQISATVYYQAQVISKITSNKNFQNKFSSVIFKQIQEDFGSYVDAKARTSPISLHHVYEWKNTGDREHRLFELKK